jgi:uncharacterized protein (TIGR03382 family)
LTGCILLATGGLGTPYSVQFALGESGSFIFDPFIVGPPAQQVDLPPTLALFGLGLYLMGLRRRLRSYPG